jgi:protein TonB
MPRELLDAIAGHELIHVFRKDWLVVLVEEVLRSLLWFHPAIWFALGEIQIAREEVVDAEAVYITQDRERYLDALLAVAEQRMVQDLAPAPLFLKKRQLARRVASIVKETSMSRLNLGARVAFVLIAALAGLGGAAWFFPFPSAAQNVPDDPGISVVAGSQLLHRPALHNGKATGTVVLDATLDKSGEVTDARVVSGPDELRRDALASVLQWHYQSNGVASSVRISIQFAQPGPQAPPPPLPPPPPPGIVLPSPPVVKSIVFYGVDPGVQDQIRNQLPLHVGDAATPEAVRAATIALQAIDEHLAVSVMNRKIADSGTNELIVQIGIRPAVNRAAFPPAVPAAPDASGNQPQRIRVGGNVQSMNLVNKITPVYPPEAKQARIQGTVRFDAVIGKDGAIQNLTLVSGHPLLVPVATDAVKQWVYKPTLLNGQPTEVETQIDINFTLAQ